MAMNICYCRYWDLGNFCHRSHLITTSSPQKQELLCCQSVTGLVTKTDIQLESLRPYCPCIHLVPKNCLSWGKSAAASIPTHLLTWIDELDHLYPDCLNTLGRVTLYSVLSEVYSVCGVGNTHVYECMHTCTHACTRTQTHASIFLNKCYLILPFFSQSWTLSKANCPSLLDMSCGEGAGKRQVKHWLMLAHRTTLALKQKRWGSH